MTIANMIHQTEIDNRSVVATFAISLCLCMRTVFRCDSMMTHDCSPNAKNVNQRSRAVLGDLSSTTKY
jgi:hypothetical protein